ncbi:MAG: transcriptional regulator FtsR [Sporichthyaceae bacterium]
MSIGEVLAMLRPDFPDVTISKIRFLEAAGLVEPERSPAGYRKFSVVDLQRLRYVLTAQRDHYLPLRVIRDQLDAIARTANLEGAPEPSAPAQPIDISIPAQRYDRAGMLAACGLGDTELAEVEAVGLLGRRRGGTYDSDDVTIAVIVAQVIRSGLDARHLRAFKGAAAREVGLVVGALEPPARRSGTLARERSAGAAAELAATLMRLHQALVTAGLRRELLP